MFKEKLKKMNIELASNISQLSTFSSQEAGRKWNDAAPAFLKISEMKMNPLEYVRN